MKAAAVIQGNVMSEAHCNGEARPGADSGRPPRRLVLSTIPPSSVERRHEDKESVKSSPSDVVEDPHEEDSSEENLETAFDCKVEETRGKQISTVTFVPRQDEAAVSDEVSRRV
ncbi:hypothetical protein F2P81_008412 [Scophthalmus maximus]|uniref:Uncharacterized protein n=1 Tax=Scophthalmus maximus TaxID=52904 RepID=A0A6A4T278_SCOMX|nr:hypothetical protein F2P81_008412 [Scophthalmus maximus]